MAGPSRTWEIFLVHPETDAQEALALYQHLSARCRVFLKSQSLLPGDDWAELAPAAQREALLTVVLWGSGGEWSHYDREDIARAVGLRGQGGDSHRLVPVWLDATAGARADAPYGLRNLTPIVVGRNKDLAQVAEELLALLARVGSPEGAPPPLPTAPPPSPSPGEATVIARRLVQEGLRLLPTYVEAFAGKEGARALLAVGVICALGLLYAARWTAAPYRLRPALDYLYPTTRTAPYPEVFDLSASSTWVALATRGGVTLVSPEGVPEQSLREREGLTSAQSRAVAVGESSLWIGTSRGPCFMPLDGRPQCLGGGPSAQDTPDPSYIRGWEVLRLAPHPTHTSCAWALLQDWTLGAFLSEGSTVRQGLHPTQSWNTELRDMLWVQSGDAGWQLYALGDQRLTLLSPRDGAPESACQELSVVEDFRLPVGEMAVLKAQGTERLWVGGRDHVCAVDRVSRVVAPCVPLKGADGAPVVRVRDLLATPNRLWVATEHGLFWLPLAELGEQSRLTAAPLPGGEGAAALALEWVPASDQRTLWVGTTQGTWRCREDGQDCLALPSRPRGFEGGELTAATRGESRPFWVGDSLGSVHTIDEPPGSLAPRLLPLRLPGGTAELSTNLRSIRALMESDGALWIGREQGVTRLRLTLDAPQMLGPLTLRSAVGVLPATRVTALAASEEGRIWVGTALGLFTDQGGGEELVEFPLPEAPGEIHALTLDPARRLWVAASNGLLCLAPPTWQESCAGGPPRLSARVGSSAPSSRAAARGVVTLHVAADGALYAGTRRGELLTLGPGAGDLTTWSGVDGWEERPEASPGPLLAIGEDSAGNLWALQSPYNADGHRAWYRAIPGQWEGPIGEAQGLDPAAGHMARDRNNTLWIGASLALPPPAGCSGQTSRAAAVLHGFVLAMLLVFWLGLLVRPEVVIAHRHRLRARVGAGAAALAGLALMIGTAAISGGLGDRLGGPLKWMLHGSALMILVASQTTGLALARAEARGRRRWLIPLATLLSGAAFLSVTAGMDRVHPVATFNCLGEPQRPIFLLTLNAMTVMVVMAPFVQSCWAWFCLRPPRKDAT